MRRLATRPLRWALEIAGRVYVPGHRLDDALHVARKLAPSGLASTLGYFQSAEDPPQTVEDMTLAIVEAVAELTPPGYVSIKAPALGYDPKRITAIAAKAKERGILAHFDSHELHTADLTLGCVRQSVALSARSGLTLPGRWQRSLGDAELACQLSARVRVVKGEWADPGEPGRDRRQGFIEVVGCLAGRASEVVIATHDASLARESLARLQAAGTPCELELLNGLPRRELLPIARQFSVPVRIYVPFGVVWRPYALRRLSGNPRMLWWLIQDSLRGAYSSLAAERNDHGPRSRDRDAA